jgi:hypothetical protein
MTGTRTSLPKAYGVICPLTSQLDTLKAFVAHMAMFPSLARIGRMVGEAGLTGVSRRVLQRLKP